MTTSDIARQDAELNSLIRKGEILDGIELHYAADCSFQEGNEAPVQGKATQLARLAEMFEGLKSFDGATLHSQAVGDGVTLTEWTFNMTAGSGDPIVWNEVISRQWSNGQVVRERYYQA